MSHWPDVQYARFLLTLRLSEANFDLFKVLIGRCVLSNWLPWALYSVVFSLQHGTCVIQPTQISFSSEELVAMVHRCGLNRLNQFAAFLANHLRASRLDPKLLSLLSSLDEVLYSGMPLAREEEEWAYRNRIKLRVRSPCYTLAYYSKPYRSRICLGALKPARRCGPLGAPKTTQRSCSLSPEHRTGLCPLGVRRMQKRRTSLLHECLNSSF